MKKLKKRKNPAKVRIKKKKRPAQSVTPHKPKGPYALYPIDIADIAGSKKFNIKCLLAFYGDLHCIDPVTKTFTHTEILFEDSNVAYQMNEELIQKILKADLNPEFTVVKKEVTSSSFVQKYQKLEVGMTTEELNRLIEFAIDRGELQVRAIQE